jgi:hypothetical protein
VAFFGFPEKYINRVSSEGDLLDPNVRSILGITVEVSGMAEIRQNLAFLNERMVKDAVEEAHRIADYILQESHKIVPYFSGDLFRSGKVDEDDDPVLKGFLVRYDTDYAWHIHEDPMAHPSSSSHPAGPGPYAGIPKTDHYLEIPAREMESDFPNVMRERLRAGVAAAARSFVHRPMSRPIGGPRLVKKPS